MSVAVEINGLSKEYETGFLRKKRTRALDDLSLSVSSGQIFGFLGGNGAGKTTTIKMLMGLIFPTSGSAQILGSSISDTRMHRRIGYCPENPYFYDYLSANELMDYFGRLFGYDAATRRTKTCELLDAVGLAEKDRRRQLRKYSKGMLQRVGLAQSLINEPEIVFLDEPMSGLDPVGRREIRELILSLRTKGVTVFMSTHILSDIEVLCDEVAILRQGKLAASGRLVDLLAADDASRTLEVRVQGVEFDAIHESIEFIAGASISPSPGGASIEILDDSDLSAVLAIVSEGGGKLVSVEPIKRSLEDLFVEQSS